MMHTVPPQSSSGPGGATGAGQRLEPLSLRDTAVQVRAALDLLGDSATQVASRLADAGVTGRRSDQSGCPVARYLHSLGLAEAPVRRLEVTRTHAVLSDGHRWSRRARIELPPGVRAFVAGFDRGQFAQLESAPRPRPSFTGDPVGAQLPSTPDAAGMGERSLVHH
ncbi:hypothetical protein GHK86_05610 [Acidimicrobiaceae bacterium USS-CC1]|uniref:Uncharacterized protein n=1 Tax=Acidiferrimicrobium australe TaxID=2664430 RepID=A0ABW9QSB5_9ACTN|nr:hypothetical protein [Acidiferrimicrobium australe]